ncbi:DNA/RNA non-specific endonuclease [Massilia sp. YIM B04103]|uniref:DNA/RNA non-specific endonuclease n=1 Tax=Massilia sp. YIM B04103 TaxID=2963106 RepID=UPI0021093DC7|nr:DNA/RNA non-specific endonuclease [Massilia sp. YIM B04103]
MLCRSRAKVAGSWEETLKPTFHRTNCTLQHFRFNQSAVYWQGAERYILEYGALKSNRRATIFTGPVLDDNWKEYGDLRVPMQFWKVIVWPGNSGGIEVTALLLDQQPLLNEKRVMLGQPDGKKEPKIDTYRVAVKHLTKVTGLDFSALTKYDTYKVPESIGGAEAIPVRVLAGWEDLM